MTARLQKKHLNNQQTMSGSTAIMMRRAFNNDFADPPPISPEERRAFHRFYKNSVTALFNSRVKPDLTFPSIDSNSIIFAWEPNDHFYWRPDADDVVIVRKICGITEEHTLHPDTREPHVKTVLWDVIYPKDIVFSVQNAVKTRMFQAMLAQHTPLNKRLILGENQIKIT